MQIILSDADYKKYPFLPDAIARIERIGLTLEDLGEGEIGNIVLSSAKEKVEETIINKRYPPPLDDADLEISSFLASLIILSEISDDFLWERFATVYSKNVRSYLEDELNAVDENVALSKLIYIGKQTARWRIILGDGKILIHFKDFVYLAPEFKGSWKLSNRILHKGFLEVSKHELVRLLETGVKKYVKKLILNVKVDYSQLPEKLYSLVEEVSRVWSKIKANYRVIRGKIDAEKIDSYFPPCIQSLLNDIKSGKNLPHSARFALASFLLNIGYSVEEVLDVFRFSPDFREDLARYQVEHIAGLRGSRIKYTPYKCDNMRSLGLCRWRCKGVRHPLTFFYRAVRGKRPEVEVIG